MHKRVAAAVAAAVAIPLLGGLAYAVTQSVDDRPAPKAVIPALAALWANEHLRDG